jgi:hypothetical protein
MKRSKYWPIAWLASSVLFIILYSYHRIETVLVGAVIFFLASIWWTERRAFSELIRKREDQIEALKKTMDKEGGAT